MKLPMLLPLALTLTLFSNCDDGGTKTPDKCKNVTCGANATCNAGTGECECDTGYTGDPDAGCTLPEPCANVTCGDHATCDAGTGECVCDEGYTGDPDTGCTLPEPCANVTCGDHATCDPESGGCACDEGYTGDPDAGCTLPDPCANVSCGDHATCDPESGECACDEGYTGDSCDACDTTAGYVASNATPGDCLPDPCAGQTCTDHGLCRVDTDDTPWCDCSTGYAGLTCDTCDTANGYLEIPAGSGTCVDTARVQPGDLVITEIMIQANTPTMADGQWFEVTNITAGNKRLADLTFTAGAATLHLPADSPGLVPAGHRVVVGANADSGTNGGVTVQFVVPGLALGTAAGTLELTRTSDGVSIDTVTWDDTWNHQDGRSLTLSPAALTQATPAATLNDDGDHWCFGAAPYGTLGTFGTPGTVNDPCRLFWCGLQGPASITTDAGSATGPIYGQVYDSLLTVGQDFNPFIFAQVGFGPVGSDPSTPGWTWFDAGYDAAFTGQNNEQVIGHLLPATAGTYDYVFRVTTDGGLSHQYCFWYDDGVGRGALTATTPPPPTSLFFSEYLEGSSNNKALEIYNPFSTPYPISTCTLRTYFNGATTFSEIGLNGTLAAHSTYVVCNAASSAAILAACNHHTTNTPMTLNGNDAVALVCDGVILDVIGQIGNNPGTEWGTGLTGTADNTLRRKCAIRVGDANGADPFNPADEWDGYAVDTIDGLGAHTTCY